MPICYTSILYIDCGRYFFPLKPGIVFLEPLNRWVVELESIAST